MHGSPRLDPGAGGTERYVHALASATGQPVFTRDRRPGPPGLDRLDGDYPLWVARAPAPAAPVFRDTWSAPEVEAALAAALHREAPALIHIHHLAHLGLAAAETAARAAPLVWTLHDYHLICARGQLMDRELRPCPGPAPRRCAACVAEHLRAAPALHQLGRLAAAVGLRQRALSLLASPPPGPAELARITRRLEAARRALGAAARVLSPSADLARRFVDLGWLRPDAVAVQDLPLVSPVPPAPPPGEGPLRLLYVGSLIPTKGADVLLEAFARLPPGAATLVLRGPAAPYDGRPGWAEALIERVEATPGARWGGIFGAGERAAVYGGADVLVVPSIWQENSPLVVREALAAGLRVVASAAGGLAELDPGARRVPPGDPAALAAALTAECALGRGRRPPRRFPMDRHIAELEAHYRAVV